MEGRCQRCWTPKNLVSHEVDANPRADPTVRKEKVALCKHCADGAPTDALLFWEVYMRFGSTRELLQHYSSETEEEALRKLCVERDLNEREVIRRARGQQSADALNSAVKKANAFLTYASPYGYDYVRNAFAFFTALLSASALCWPLARRITSRSFRSRSTHSLRRASSSVSEE